MSRETLVEEPLNGELEGLKTFLHVNAFRKLKCWGDDDARTVTLRAVTALERLVVDNRVPVSLAPVTLETFETAGAALADARTRLRDRLFHFHRPASDRLQHVLAHDSGFRESDSEEASMPDHAVNMARGILAGGCRPESDGEFRLLALHFAVDTWRRVQGMDSLWRRLLAVDVRGGIGQAATSSDLACLREHLDVYVADAVAPSLLHEASGNPLWAAAGYAAILSAWPTSGALRALGARMREVLGASPTMRLRLQSAVVDGDDDAWWLALGPYVRGLMAFAASAAGKHWHVDVLESLLRRTPWAREIDTRFPGRDSLARVLDAMCGYPPGTGNEQAGADEGDAIAASQSAPAVTTDSSSTEDDVLVGLIEEEAEFLRRALPDEDPNQVEAVLYIWLHHVEKALREERPHAPEAIVEKVLEDFDDDAETTGVLREFLARAAARYHRSAVYVLHRRRWG